MQTDGFKHRARMTALVMLLVLMASCLATQRTVPDASGSIPGFWRGLWHGFIAPVAFIVSLFSNVVRIYAVPNAGRWYDFGFMISGFSGGIFAGHRTRAAATSANIGPT